MTILFPAGLDDFSNPSPDSPLPGHAQKHTDLNDAVEALEAKVGVDSSTVPDSLDYRLSQLELDGLTNPVDHIDFVQTPAVADAERRFTWDEGNGTLALGLRGGNVILQLGQEEVQLCYNASGSALSDGELVLITGAQGNRVKVTRAQADAEATSAQTIGMVTEPIASGAEGFVTNQGLVRHLNTINDSEGHALTEGDMLFLSTSVAGGYTKVKPTAPQHLVVIGFVIRVHATVGEIFIKVDNGYELDELHNVLISSPANGQVLTYETASGTWKNKTPASGGGGSLTNTVVSVSTGSSPISSFSVVITDAAISTSTKLTVQVEPLATASNSLEDHLHAAASWKLIAVPGAGSFTLYIDALTDLFWGDFNIRYSY